MSAKKVKLICGDQSQEFPFDIAQSLMYIRQEMNKSMVKKKKGWELPDDSPYEFIDNGLIKRSDTKANKKSASSGRNSEGNSTSE